MKKNSLKIFHFEATFKDNADNFEKFNKETDQCNLKSKV